MFVLSMKDSTQFSYYFCYFQTGFLAACPYLFKAILGPLGGVTADVLIRYKVCRIGTVRKSFYAAGKTENNAFTIMCPKTILTIVNAILV